MSSVIQVCDDHDMHAMAKQRRVRNAIGTALARHYPWHPWHISVSGDSSVAQITCPGITTRYGMVLHCKGETLDLERKAVRMAGELLERYRVSRIAGDFDHIRKNALGEAVGAHKGEG